MPERAAKPPTVYRVAQDFPEALAGAHMVLPRTGLRIRGQGDRDDRIDVSRRGPA